MSEISYEIGAIDGHGAFGRPSTSDNAFTAVEQLGSDVVVIPNAYSAHDALHHGAKERVAAQAKELGYVHYLSNSLDATYDPRGNGRQMATLVKSEIPHQAAAIGVKESQVQAVSIVDFPLNIVAADFDPRDIHARNVATKALLACLMKKPEDGIVRPTIIIGNLGYVATGQIANARRLAAQEHGRDITGQSYVAQVLDGLSDQTSGNLLRQAGFGDADPLHHPTELVLGSGFQLTRILFSEEHFSGSQNSLDIGIVDYSKWTDADTRGIKTRVTAPSLATISSLQAA